jgi:hypothetical protein
MSGVNARFVEDMRHEGCEARQRPLETRGNSRPAQARQVGPQHAKLLTHARHPRVPHEARFGVAVDQDSGFRLAPRLAEPVLAVEKILGGLVARRHHLGNRPHGAECIRCSCSAEHGRGAATEVQHIATRTCDSHGFLLRGFGQSEYDTN